MTTNEKFYAECPKCGRETLWLTSTVGQPGSYGYNCNSCGTLTKVGDPVYEAIEKKKVEAK